MSHTKFLISKCLTSGFAILICGVLATWRLGRSDFWKILTSLIESPGSKFFGSPKVFRSRKFFVLLSEIVYLLDWFCNVYCDVRVYGIPKVFWKILRNVCPECEKSLAL